MRKASIAVLVLLLVRPTHEHGWMTEPVPRSGGGAGSGNASTQGPCGNDGQALTTAEWRVGTEATVYYKRANSHGNSGNRVELTLSYTAVDSDPPVSDDFSPESSPQCWYGLHAAAAGGSLEYVLAVSTAGPDAFVIPSSSSVAFPGGEMTVEFWVRHVVALGSQSVQLYKGSDYSLSLVEVGGNWKIRASFDGIAYSSDTGISADLQWHHLALTFEPNKLTVYLDAEPVQLTTSGSTCFDHVGCYDVGSADFAVTSSSMTHSLCAETCYGLGYSFGLTYDGSDCYCSDDYGSTVGTCDQPCSGDGGESCGASVGTSYDVVDATTCSVTATTVPSTSPARVGYADFEGLVDNLRWHSSALSGSQVNASMYDNGDTGTVKTGFLFDSSASGGFMYSEIGSANASLTTSMANRGCSSSSAVEIYTITTAGYMDVTLATDQPHTFTLPSFLTPGPAVVQFIWRPTNGGAWYDCAYIDVLEPLAGPNQCLNASKYDCGTGEMCSPLANGEPSCVCAAGYFNASGVCTLLSDPIDMIITVRSVEGVSQNLFTEEFGDLLGIPHRILYDRSTTADSEKKDEIDVYVSITPDSETGDLARPYVDEFIDMLETDDDALYDLSYIIVGVRAEIDLPSSNAEPEYIARKDDNECKTASACDGNAKCTNLIAGHFCTCRSSYVGPGSICYAVLTLELAVEFHSFDVPAFRESVADFLNIDSSEVKIHSLAQGGAYEDVEFTTIVEFSIWTKDHANLETKLFAAVKDKDAEAFGHKPVRLNGPGYEEERNRGTPVEALVVSFSVIIAAAVIAVILFFGCRWIMATPGEKKDVEMKGKAKSGKVGVETDKKGKGKAAAAKKKKKGSESSSVEISYETEEGSGSEAYSAYS